MPVASAPTLSRASATVSNTGSFRCVVPPFPGVTPPVTLVPYAIACSVWYVPCAPVKPCVITRVAAFTRIAMSGCLFHGANDFLGGIGEILRRYDRHIRLRQDVAAQF